jgi:phospholipid/cholesterol/gamma-HCH transport system substrate-binding protein
MAAKKKAGWADLRVGLLVLASIATTIVLILAVAGDINLFKDEMELYTDLPGAEGLKRGDEVRLAGVLVGSVQDVEFGEVPESLQSKSSVIIRISVDRDIAEERIRTDSRAILRSIGLLGGQYINITPGTKEGDPVTDGAVIRGIQETTIQGVVESSEDLLNGFKQLTARLNEITEKINSNEGTVGRFINDETFYVNLNKTALEAQELVRRIREGKGTAGMLINDPKLYEDIRASVNSLQSVVNDLQAGKGTMGKLLRDDEVYRNMNSAVARLNSASERVERIVAQVETGNGTINRLLYDEKLYKETSEAVASLKTITGRLERGEGTAGKMLHDDQLYNNLNQLSAESVKLLYDFRQNPKKYLSIKVSLF